MPVSFKQIAAGTATATVQSTYGPIIVEYYPNKITDKMIAEMQATRDADTPMIEFIKSWDIYDGDPSVMFPIERIDELGVGLKVAIMQAIMGDIRPNSVTPQS